MPLFRVTVSPVGKDGKNFALAVAMDHVLADGFT